MDDNAGITEVELPEDIVSALRIYTQGREQVKYHGTLADEARDKIIAYLQGAGATFGLVDREPMVKLTSSARRGVDIGRLQAERPALFEEYRKDSTYAYLTLVGKHRGARDDG